MSASKSLYYLLSNDTGVSALVSDRIYPLRAPQGYSAPFIVYRKIATVTNDQKDDISLADFLDYDIECWANSYISVETIALAVRSALDNKSISSQGSNIADITFALEDDGYDEDAELFNKTLQFRLTHIK